MNTSTSSTFPAGRLTFQSRIVKENLLACCQKCHKECQLKDTVDIYSDKEKIEVLKSHVFNGRGGKFLREGQQNGFLNLYENAYGLYYGSKSIDIEHQQSHDAFLVNKPNRKLKRKNENESLADKPLNIKDLSVKFNELSFVDKNNQLSKEENSLNEHEGEDSFNKSISSNYDSEANVSVNELENLETNEATDHKNISNLNDSGYDSFLTKDNDS